MERSFTLFEAYDYLIENPTTVMYSEDDEGCRRTVGYSHSPKHDSKEIGVMFDLNTGYSLEQMYSLRDLKTMKFFIKEESGYWKKVDNQEETISCIMNNDKMKIDDCVHENYVNTTLLESIFSVNSRFRAYLNNEIEYWVSED